LEVGGAERLLIDFFDAYEKARARCAAPRAVDVAYLVTNDRVDPGLRAQLLATGAAGAFWGRAEGSGRLGVLRRLLAHVRAGGFRVVHAQNTGTKYWGMLLKMLVPGLRLVFTVHNTYDVPTYRGLKLFLHRRLVDANIAVSRAVLAGCEAQRLPHSLLIYNGIQAGRIRGKEGYALPAPPAPPRLVCTSRLVPELKGQHVILDALALCIQESRPFRIVFVCGTEGGYAEAHRGLLARAEALGIPDGLVEFAGQRPDVWEILCGFDGYVHAAFSEALGLALLEAMAAGLPAVAPDSAGPAELITHGETGLLYEAGSARALADAVGRLFFEAPEAERQRIGGAARAFAQTCDIAEMAAAYCRLYEEVAAR
jgi:glycosyltransferase involved in cell wall biosynthesis